MNISILTDALRPEQIGNLWDNIFRGIFLKGNDCIFIKMSLKFVLQVQIDYKSALVLTQGNNLGWYLNKNFMYRQVSNIRCTLVGNKTLYHSGVVGASPVVATSTISSFST